MNLIEQLGGYEKASKIYRCRPPTATTYFHGKYYENWSKQKWVRFDYDQAIDCKKPGENNINLGILGLMLLEYRRQHKIFEIGDLYVFTEKYSKESTIYKVDSLKSGKGCIRHATDEEIAAGRRL